MEDEDDDGFNITCTAIGVYPEPEIRLYKVRSINEVIESREIDSANTTVLSFRSLSDGLYSITLMAHIDSSSTPTAANKTSNIHGSDDTQSYTELESSNEVTSPARERLVWNRSFGQGTAAGASKKNRTTVAEHYECRLTIPFSDFVAEKRLAIQDGKSYFSFFFAFSIQVLDNNNLLELKIT